jgi:uncharacterized membrane protein
MSRGTSFVQPPRAGRAHDCGTIDVRMHHTMRSSIARSLEMRRTCDKPTPSATWSGLVFSCGAVSYALVLAALATRTSLWVDEVLQLLGTRDEPTVTGLLKWVMINPGGVPLGYLTQKLAIHGLGYSSLTARLPSIIFAVLTCFGVAVMCRQLGLRCHKMAAVILAASPLVFRYGFEARPYSQALFTTICTSVIFLWLQERPVWKRMGVYVATVAIGLYTQPFSVFIPVAHAASMVLDRDTRKRECTQSPLHTLIAVAIGCLLFLPWMLAAHHQWRTSIATSKYAFSLNVSLLSSILREVGGSYLITSLLIAACLTALRLRSMPRRASFLLIMMIVIPLFGTLVADAIFGYFFAARQLLFLLPPLTILASEGISELLKRRTSWGAAVLISILVASLHQDIRMVLKPREDWHAAALNIGRSIGADGCFLAAPTEWAALYEFFDHDLTVRRCSDSALRSADPIVLAITPYTAAEDVRAALVFIAQAGLRNDPAEQVVGATRLKVFRR